MPTASVAIFATAGVRCGLEHRKIVCRTRPCEAIATRRAQRNSFGAARRLDGGSKPCIPRLAHDRCSAHIFCARSRVEHYAVEVPVTRTTVPVMPHIYSYAIQVRAIPSSVTAHTIIRRH